MKDIAKSFKEATTAIEVGAVFDTEKNDHQLRESGHWPSDLSAADHAVRDCSCPRYSSKGSIDSLDQETLFTIQKFFENNLNVSETSRKLFVHRNTLVYRLGEDQKADRSGSA